MRFRRCPCGEGVQFLWLGPLWWVCRMCRRKDADQAVWAEMQVRS